MKNPSTVFVGNIDFDVPEEKIVEELSAVGRVVHFKLMYDKQTGKSKGFGFCEYESPLIAEKAIRTLNIMFNNRSVKINHTGTDAPEKPKEESSVHDIDSITNVLDTMDKDNLKEVLLYIKQLAIDQPSYLKELLMKNSKLIYSLLYSLHKLKIVGDSMIEELIAQSFGLEEHQIQILERVRSMSNDEIDSMPESIRNKVFYLRSTLFKQ